jgi:hypothetical protein
MKLSVVILAVTAVLGSSAAMAGSVTQYDFVTTTTGSASKSSTKAYAGLNWKMGGGMTPAVVLGVASTKTKSNGDTYGANLAFHFDVAGGFKPGKLKLSYLDGKENLQGELGIGYDFLKTAPLVGLGVNAPHLAAGVDGYLSHGFVPYATLHTLSKFDKPSRRTTTNCVPVVGGSFELADCTNPPPPEPD